MRHNIIIIAIIILIFALAIALESIKRRKINADIQKISDLQERSLQYVDDLKQNQQELRRFKYDLTLHEREVERFVYGDNKPEGIITCYTGNDTIDALLSAKAEQLKRENIEFIVDTKILENFPCGDMDTISLLDNLLDNAMEACKIAHENEKATMVIRIQIDEYSQNDIEIYRIQIENTKTGQSHPLERQFATTKEDSLLHGNGTKIVNYLVDKYNGKITHQDLGARFLVNIELPKIMKS